MNEQGFFEHQVPKIFQGASLETCERQHPSLVEFGREWAKEPRSLFLCGGYGTGKTYYAFALIREMFRVCKRHIWPRYFTSPQLDARLLKASKSEEGDEYDVRNIAEQDLLMIDDIGRETRWDRLKRQYFEILNYRYCQQLPTILTSNLSLDQLSEIVDGAIASRMQEWQNINFTGGDMRKTKNSQK